MIYIMKKAFSVCLASIMLVTAPFVISAEDTADVAAPAADEVNSEAAVRFTVGEPDENGIFTAKLSLHNLQFLAMEFGISFDNSVINFVDEEGNPTSDFSEAGICNPVQVEGSAFNLSQLESTISNEEGYLYVASYILLTNTESNLVTADENGVTVYEFRFKEIAEGDYGFELLDSQYTDYGKAAIISAGYDIDFTFEFIYPEEKAENNTSNHYEVSDTEQEDPAPESESTKEEQRDARKKDTVVLQVNNYAVSVEGVIKWVDKDNKNVVPYIENDRTMVPLRFISESFGADVQWIPETRTIEIALGDTTITMQLDNTEYQLNGENKSMDTAPVIREDRTFVPIRFVSEALDKSVYWNESNGIVIVAPIDNPWDDTDSVSQELLTDTLLAFKWLRDEAYSYTE